MNVNFNSKEKEAIEYTIKELKWWADEGWKYTWANCEANQQSPVEIVKRLTGNVWDVKTPTCRYQISLLRAIGQFDIFYERILCENESMAKHIEAKRNRLREYTRDIPNEDDVHAPWVARGYADDLRQTLQSIMEKSRAPIQPAGTVQEDRGDDKSESGNNVRDLQGTSIPVDSDELIVLTTIGSKKGIKHSELLDHPRIVSWAFLKPILICLATKEMVEVHRGRGFAEYQSLRILLKDDPGFKIAELTAGKWRYRLTEEGYTLINRGNTGAKPDTEVANQEPTPRNIFRKTGDYWTIEFCGTVKHIEDCPGLSYIKLLIENKGQTFTTAEFLSLYNDGKPVVLGNGDKKLDDEAKKTYETRLSDIEYQLEEAEKNNDTGTQEKLGADKAALSAEIIKASGFGGRDVTLNSEFNKYRLAVGTAIKRAISRIDEHIPELAKYLNDAIPHPHSGTSLSYHPAEPIDWAL